METSDISLVHWWLKVCLSHSSFSTGTPAVTICKGLWTSVLAHLMLMKCHTRLRNYFAHGSEIISSHWSTPLGYFCKQGLWIFASSSCFVLTIGRLSDIGITVLAVTSDASAHSVQMAKALGIHLDGDNTKCISTSSSSSQQIAYFFDSCHLLKLIKKCISEFPKHSVYQWHSTLAAPCGFSSARGTGISTHMERIPRENLQIWRTTY